MSNALTQREIDQIVVALRSWQAQEDDAPYECSYTKMMDEAIGQQRSPMSNNEIDELVLKIETRAEL